jgi:hypothetical protein
MAQRIVDPEAGIFGELLDQRKELLDTAPVDEVDGHQTREPVPDVMCVQPRAIVFATEPEAELVAFGPVNRERLKE